MIYLGRIISRIVVMLYPASHSCTPKISHIKILPTKGARLSQRLIQQVEYLFGSPAKLKGSPVMPFYQQSLNMDPKSRLEEGQLMGLAGHMQTNQQVPPQAIRRHSAAHLSLPQGNHASSSGPAQVSLAFVHVCPFISKPSRP